MKKFICVFLVIFLCANYVSAQKGTHEIYAHYGMASDNAILDGLSKILGTVFTLGYYQPQNIHYSGDFGLTYRYNLSNRFSLGATAMYEQSTYNSYFNNEFKGNGTTSFISVAAEGNLKYVKGTNVCLYGYLGFGATVIGYHFKPSTENNETIERKIPFFMFNMQITPLGISVGKNIGGFAELGVGYKGILTLGAYCRF